ncbi:MAG: peroxiredoxin family protein, partial [Proteobacteria bacterium]|nr:peroxiredoxin family protein [Pseudomonadota bacterium]
VQVWGIAPEPDATIEAFRDALGLTFPVMQDTAKVQDAYAQELAFETAAYPQDWVIGVDQSIAYKNNGYEPDEVIAVLEEELGR